MKWTKNIINIKKLLLFPFLLVIILIQIEIISNNLLEVIDEKNIEKIKKHLELDKN